MRMTDDLTALGFSNERFTELMVNFYGKPDAGRIFYDHLTAILLLFPDLEQSADQPCLFTTSQEVGECKQLVAGVHVNDIIVAGSWTEKIAELEAHIAAHCRSVKFRDLTKFLGLEVVRNRSERTLTVAVSGYTNEVVQKFAVESASETADTPLFPSVEYRGLSGQEQPIWGFVGSVRFLADTTWPDLKVAASLLGSAGATPHRNHKVGAIRCCKYIKACKEGRCIKLGGDDPIILSAYC